jgi:hypothetical protein
VNVPRPEHQRKYHHVHREEDRQAQSRQCTTIANGRIVALHNTVGNTTTQTAVDCVILMIGVTETTRIQGRWQTAIAAWQRVHSGAHPIPYF